MRALELRIPPPVVALLVALAMWGVSLETSRIDVAAALRNAAAILLGAVGFACAIAGVVAIRRARTTTSPIKPETATSLVTSGIYRFTRNPMYLGLCFVLLAWAVFLSSAWALLGPVAFALYIGRFQITPEEKVLSKLFGPAFAEYQSKVRRWL
jgi:protein-S-isoprenylcysteine O-methyltransferase Ste14